SAIPGVGEAIVTWLWGGYAVGNPTLQRFYSLHYLLPFVIAGVVVLHIWALHVVGQNNPTGIDPKSERDTVSFTPYATIKDAFLPWLDTSRVRSANYRPMYFWYFWIFVGVCICLGWLGAKPAEGGYVIAARILTFYYFFHFLIILPVLGWVERTKPLPNSISE